MRHRFRIDRTTTPLDLPQCVSCGQVFLWHRRADGTYLGVDGDAVFVAKVEDRAIFVESTHDEDRFRHLFRLDFDLRQLEAEFVRCGPELAPYVARWPGLRLMRPHDPVETTFCFLCTANNHLARIARMTRCLQQYGPVLVEVEVQPVRAFPTLERIAAIPEEELRTQGFGYRGRTIPHVARQILDRGGLAWLGALGQAPYPEAHARLTDLDGVGPKLADCICLFALGHTEAVPVDTHLWQAAVREYFPQWANSHLTPARYQTIGTHFRERFGPWAGWAHHYLFYDHMVRTRAPSSLASSAKIG